MRITVLLCMTCLAGPTCAATITYEAVNLVDTTPGSDLWQYKYRVSGQSFNSNNGFSILFGPANYAAIEDPAPAVNSDWDILVLQPDATLPADGRYDALALADGASLQDIFSISFEWKGTGSPGSQRFEIYDDAFNVVESGETTAVPLLPALPLLSTALVGLMAFNRKKSK